MAVDVTTERTIEQPIDVVAAYAADPSHACEWYRNITAVDWVPGQRLVMRTAQGPFPMETTCTWRAIDDRTTTMTLRNAGRPAGFSKLVAPFLAPAMRRANRKDLAALAQILESA